MLPRRIACLGLSAGLLAGLFTIGACDGGTEAPKEITASSTAELAANAGTCVSYATQLCEQVGQDSSTCEAIHKTTQLMPDEACAAGLANMEFSTQKIGELGAVCDELTERLCADLGPETKTCEMVRTQGVNFAPDECTEMLAAYPQVVSELMQAELRNKPLTADQRARLAAGDAPDFGPADAKVTIVEFSDFQCPYCELAAEATSTLKKKYGDRVRIVFRQFPLSFHDKAHLAAQASLAAHAQGKFWEYHDLLFANQDALDRDALEGHAKKIGLDITRFRKDLDDTIHAKTVDADLSMGQEIFVDGTPTMFVNGVRVDNPTDIESISSAVDAALAG